METQQKIGLLNFQYSEHNYGAVLQAAALEYTLRELGYTNVEHINFIPQRKRSIKGRIGGLLRRLGLRKPAPPGRANKEAFERFREQHIQRSALVTAHRDFVKLAAEYRAIVVGSDQVWRPSMAHNANVFFLADVPKQVKRISYAASFGVDCWEPPVDAPVTQMAKRELPLFTAISTREDSGVTICQEHFAVEAKHVLDPLLLVQPAFFDKVEGTSTRDYANFVYYKLDTDDAFFADVRQLEQQFGFTARNIYQHGLRDEPAFEDVDVWLSSLRHADVVLTDSFHCVCVALRFAKKVLFIVNDGRGKARFDSLFKMFDIEITPLKGNYSTNVFELSAPHFGERYDELRARSLNFLQQSLGSDAQAGASSSV